MRTFTPPRILGGGGLRYHDPSSRCGGGSSAAGTRRMLLLLNLVFLVSVSLVLLMSSVERSNFLTMKTTLSWEYPSLFATREADSLPVASASPREHDDDDAGPEIGILSTLLPEFFRDLQQRIDEDDNIERCQRYGFNYTVQNKSVPNNNTRALPPPSHRRRIFFGGMSASETWELYEIVGAEVFGIFEAVVLVESNRTQNFQVRNFTHLNTSNHAQLFADIYGIPSPSKVQIRQFLSDDQPHIDAMEREQRQRYEVLLGWKELGMTADDVGLLSDPDECLTRDFLRAIQVCDVIPELDYAGHQCRDRKHGVRAATMVFESSPECITKDREWFHPSMFIGACLEQIGNETAHPHALRYPGSHYRLGDESRTDSSPPPPSHPLINGADFRAVGGVKQYYLDRATARDKNYNTYTAFHFHNFFAQPSSIRFKYFSYGHSDARAYEKTLPELNGDLALMVRCVKDAPDPPDRPNEHRVLGGFEALRRFRPIYFQDPLYRRKRHDFVRDLVLADELEMEKVRRNATPAA